MKIIQTPTRFFPRRGGIEEAALQLSRKLVKRGNEVKVICADQPVVGDIKVEGIDVRRLKVSAMVSNTPITLGLYKEILKYPCDIIHTHFPHPWSADISALAAVRSKKPFFLTYHNDIVGEGFNNFIAGCYNNTALRFLFNTAQKIFIDSPYYLDRSVYLKDYKKKIVVAPLGVDTEKIYSVKCDKISENSLFFLSRLDEFHRYKGLEHLIKAMGKVCRKLPLKLYVGGEGDFAYFYKNIAKELGIEDSVIFLGLLSDEDMVRYYNCTDVFVLPSLDTPHEGFGLVALEAMACGKPVIVSSITAVAHDVKENKAGIVINPGSVDDLAAALSDIFNNRHLMSDMGDNAFKIVKAKYNWDVHSSLVEDEYKKVS